MNLRNMALAQTNNDLSEDDAIFGFPGALMKALGGGGFRQRQRCGVGCSTSWQQGEPGQWRLDACQPPRGFWLEHGSRCSGQLGGQGCIIDLPAFEPSNTMPPKKTCRGPVDISGNGQQFDCSAPGTCSPLEGLSRHELDAMRAPDKRRHPAALAAFLLAVFVTMRKRSIG
jgi:hypothetical protein